MVRRLLQAYSEPEIRNAMDVEDEILEELQDLERIIEQKDKALEENAKALAEKDRMIQDLQRKLEGK